MAVHPEVVKAIDELRRNGSTFDGAVERLKLAGVPNAEAQAKEYAKLPLPDGRPRGQVNPGDPAERGVR